MHPVKDCEKLKQPTSSHGQIQNVFSMLVRSIGQKEKKNLMTVICLGLKILYKKNLI